MSTSADTIGYVASGTYENWDTATGSTILPGQSVYHGDVALATLSSGKASHAYIYRGGTNSNTVTNV